MKRSLNSFFIRKIFPRLYSFPQIQNLTYSPLSNSDPSVSPKQLIWSMAHQGTYRFQPQYKMLNYSYRHNPLDLSNQLYMKTLQIQELELFKSLYKDSQQVPFIRRKINSMIESQFMRMSDSTRDQFYSELDLLIKDTSTIAKIKYSNQDYNENLPVSFATNTLYLLSLTKPALDNDVNIIYKFCFDILRQKIGNIHLEGIAHALWSIYQLSGEQLVKYTNGANAQQIIDRLLKELQSHSFGDEIRYVDALGNRVDRLALRTEYLKSQKDDSKNISKALFNDNLASIIIIKALQGIDELGVAKVSSQLLQNLRKRSQDVYSSISRTELLSTLSNNLRFQKPAEYEKIQ